MQSDVYVLKIRKIQCSEKLKHSYLLGLLGCRARSQEDGVLHASSPLLLRVHLSVCRLTVSIISWLMQRLTGSRSSHFRASPGFTPFSISNSFVKESSTRLLARCSRTIPMTVGESRVSAPSTFAEPASWSALSLPLTPACPGQKIHCRRLILLVS